MKKLVLLFLFFSFLPILASAYVFSGPISEDTTWSPAGGVYVIDSSFSVAIGATLTIEPGTIIKAKTTSSGGPSIYGRLVARGSSAAPIYFTSIYDDSVGGDTDGDGGATAGEPGQWQGLYFKSGSEGVLENVDVSYSGYGGYGYGDFVAIQNDGGNLNINHSNIHDNLKITSNGAGGAMSIGRGIHNKSGELVVTNSIIENNVFGIYIDSGTSTISNNLFKNNVDSTGYFDGHVIYAGGAGTLTFLNNTFSGNKKIGGVDIAKKFIHRGNINNDLENWGFEMSGTIKDDIVVYGEDLIPIFKNVKVLAGATLTIEPGTIIKMYDYYSSGAIEVFGTLIAKGTKDKKIYFTSLKDDTVGGDTNGDGNNTTPAPKNWNAVFLENGSKAEFDNVVLRYSGFNYNGEYLVGVAAAIYQRGANFSVSNSVLEYNWGAAIYQDAGTTTIKNSEIAFAQEGIWSRGGSASISQSSFHDISDQAVFNQSGIDTGWWWQTHPLQIIDARNNWWNSTDGPEDISVTTPTGNGERVSQNVLYTPFLTAPPSEKSFINPVIIIPGIMGSAKKNGELLIDPILHTYDDLIATFEANGYQKDKNLFTFPYEWRDSNVITANLLKDKISAVKAACEIAQGAGAISQTLGPTDCSKVDLVAHSMGGLVAREYIQSGNYQNDIDQLIFLGTPHKGSPSAYLQWEGGKFNPDPLSQIIQLKFSLEALHEFYPSLFDYIHNRPISSVQELLPIFDYIKDKDTGILRTYPNNYPRNIFLEALNTQTGISKLLNSGVKITNIIGNSGDNTTEIIRVVPSPDQLWANGEPDGFEGSTIDHGLENGTGDDTVTVFGATLDNFIANIVSDSDHTNLPSKEEENLFKILTNKVATTSIHRSKIQKILSIQLLSPIDVVITAPDGKKIGKNFATGGEYNEIPDAFYSGFNNGDDEYITIPNPLDGNYKIEVQGTNSGGEYGVLTSLISEATSTTNQIIGITKPNQITELNTKIDNQNQTITETEKVITLEVFKNDINGAYDLGWIKDKKTRDAILKQVEGAIKLQKKIETIYEKLPNGKKKEKRIEKMELKVNKILLKLFEKELELLFKKNKITKEGLNLLKLDIKYLLNNN